MRNQTLHEGSLVGCNGSPTVAAPSICSLSPGTECTISGVFSHDKDGILNRNFFPIAHSPVIDRADAWEAPPLDFFGLARHDDPATPNEGSLEYVETVLGYNSVAAGTAPNWRSSGWRWNLTLPFDFNRDRMVTAVDQIIVRHHVAVFNALKLIAAPAADAVFEEAFEPIAANLITPPGTPAWLCLRGGEVHFLAAVARHVSRHALLADQVQELSRLQWRTADTVEGGDHQAVALAKLVPDGRAARLPFSRAVVCLQGVDGIGCRSLVFR